jgi:hypothetical protein
MEPSIFTAVRYAPDEDGLIQGRIYVTNQAFSGAVEDYFADYQLRDFGVSLQQFPSKLHHEVTFENGIDTAGFRGYLFMRAYVHDSAGHVAVQFKLRVTAAPVLSAYADFSILTEAASVNGFGRALVAWVTSGQEFFEHSFYRSS